MTQKEKAPSRAIVSRPVKQAVEKPNFIKPAHRSQESFFGPVTTGAARHGLSEWRIAHEEAQRCAELTWSRNLKAQRQAKKVLRSGGFLLNVDPRTEAERHISVKEASEGVAFLSVWIRSGMEITLTRNQGERGRPISVPPPGRGWRFHHLHIIEHSTEWCRAHGEVDRS